MCQFKRFTNDKMLCQIVCMIGIFVVFSLITTIAILLWYLLTPFNWFYAIDETNLVCPPNPCLSTLQTTRSSVWFNATAAFISISTTEVSISTMTTVISTTVKETMDKKRTYKESCNQSDECYIEFGLLCEYGWSENKSCLCEGSHYWSTKANKCLRKGEINETCDNDYQCHHEIGLVCDRPPDAPQKICICAANIYWAKDSNCGQKAVRSIVDCINENYATTCLVLGTNNIYHRLTVRSISEQELSFDWFLVDNRILGDLPQLSCTFNNETKYCFGLSIQDSQHSLKLVQFTRKGFHSVEKIGGDNQGTAFGLTSTNYVAVFVRTSQNLLYRRIVGDDEVLSEHPIASEVSGDPMCYIYELSNNQIVYCFVRNSKHGLTEYVESPANTWRATQLGNHTDRIRDETAPACSYVGKTYRYCFAVFEDGQIYRIISKSGIWGTWQVVGRERQYRFISQPTFVTSKYLNQSSTDQKCFLLAIDINYDLQVSINFNCALSDNFNDWISVSSDLKFKQFNKTFRLRDGNVGILGIDSFNRPYYIYLNSKTDHFTSPRPAFTVKSQQFRP